MVQLLPADRAAGGERPVGDEEGDAGPADHHEGRRRPVQEDADARDAQHDEHQVRDRADSHHQGDVGTLDALAENKRVLRADRDNEGQPGREAGEQGQDHHSTVGVRPR